MELRNLTVAVGADVLLSNMSLAVAVGERVCLHGASGSGKSTLFRCLLGLQLPQSGQIRIQGELLSAESVWRLRRQIAWVPQEPNWGQADVREVLCRPFAFLANRDQIFAPDDMMRWMDHFGLPESLLEKRADCLSGGERQRLGIVAALLLNRPILLLDEVTSALDADNRERVRRWLSAESRDRTILAISHHAEAETWSDRMIDLEAGHA